MLLAGLRRASHLAASVSGAAPAQLILPRTQRLLARRGFASPDDFDLIQGASGRALISSYNDEGFAIGDVQYPGPVLCYQSLVLRWGPGVASVRDVTVESLAAALLLRPRPELILLGTGAALQRLDPAVRQKLVNQGILVDCIDTRNAVATFNVLQQEGRNVLAALLPVTAGGGGGEGGGGL